MDAGDGRNSLYTEPQAGGLIDFQYLGMVFFVVLIIGSIFEVGLLIFAYINADKVECNLLWCTFTLGESISIKDSYSTQNLTSKVTTTSQCFVNDIEVNCSELDSYKNKFGHLIP